MNIYRHLFASDSEITYNAFRKQVSNFLREEAQATAKNPRELAATAQPEGTPYGRSPSRSFEYNPNVSEDDEVRLVGGKSRSGS